ncbi:MAG: hypothetical protein Q8K65_09400 [Alphaproteobacteria bacterium]|nr:hypothetical protein [Alphaproteobacteria bacterium]
MASALSFEVWRLCDGTINNGKAFFFKGFFALFFAEIHAAL